MMRAENVANVVSSFVVTIDLKSKWKERCVSTAKQRKIGSEKI